MASGGRPPSDSIRAPIRSSGSMTLRIGRRDSDSSPVNADGNRWPARIPARRRMVVPELPASSGCAAERSCPKPRPSTLTVPAGPSRISTPNWRRHDSVDRQSAPGANPARLDVPSARAASSAYRCEIDLSPGTRNRPCSRPAGATILTEDDGMYLTDLMVLKGASDG